MSKCTNTVTGGKPTVLLYLHSRVNKTSAFCFRLKWTNTHQIQNEIAN